MWIFVRTHKPTDGLQTHNKANGEQSISSFVQWKTTPSGALKRVGKVFPQNVNIEPEGPNMTKTLEPELAPLQINMEPQNH